MCASSMPARPMADSPRQRVAGAVMITDGEVHDVPPPDRLAFDAPLHALLTGQPGEADRRLVVKDAPSFGLVGKELTLTVRVEDLPDSGQNGQARLTLRKDGGPPSSRVIPVGRDVPVSVAIDHGGPNVLELEAEAGAHELTLDNNRAALVINGVRDRLKVLLVSGEPHQGERTWRNILKSDPSVDLIHFTILRPPEKQDGTPIRELSLIAFPIRELFDVKIDEFDLIIFDRYRRRSILPQAYLENIARYVKKGGALLEAAGPTFGTPMSLYRTPLGAVLPAEPTGNVYEEGFLPKVSDIGRRHPVTDELPGDSPDGKQPPKWGRWFRHVEAEPHRGVSVMSGLSDRPLLVLNREGDGRVAQLLSDEMWLWTRGFEGGGPQAELLRRVVYWLMKEPDLEENDLRAAAGALNPIELADVRTTDEKLKPAAQATGGGIHWIGPGALPDLRRVAPDRGSAGRNWIGFRANGDYVVTGVKEVPLLPGFLALLLALGTFIAAWRREGR